MNVFLCDARRAFLSWRTLIGLTIMLAVLFTTGVVSDLFRISVPLVCTLPYTTAWLSEYQNNNVKYAVYRSGRKKYIFSKFLCCAIAGGTLEAIAAVIYSFAQGKGIELNIIVDYELGCNIALLMLSGTLWAGLSALLAAISNSRYIAYGGSFTIYYFLVIFQERYFNNLYFLNPCNWYAPQLAISGSQVTAAIIQVSVIIGLMFAYYFVLRGKIKNV